MSLATVRDAGQRGARAELDQFTAIGGPGALAGAAPEPSGFGSAEIAERYRRWIEEIAPGRLLARLRRAAGRWLGARERRTPPACFRMAFTLPETPSPSEMTIIETPFRIPRYMDHPEWRPR
jgi:hypothetical protein